MKINIRNILNNVSTIPRRKSYVWRDGCASILSFVMLWTIYLCRVFSVLQWVKIVYRKVARQKTIDKGSKRVNVPVAVVEMYFCLWFVFLTFIYCKLESCSWTVIVSFYFIFESTVWVLYYFIFRRFFEENYRINHVLEYFVVLIVLIPAQAFAFSNCYGIDIHMTINAVLGIQNIEAYYWVNIVGMIYQVIVIAMIISTFPLEETFVKTQNVFDNTIIGAGDVVAKRLLPQLQYRQEKVSNIFSISGSECQIENSISLMDTKEILEMIKSKQSSNMIVWIETPTPSHEEYVSELKDINCKLLVLEKPVANKKDSLDKIDRIIEDIKYKNKVFLLSYYMIEKALPIVYYWKNGFDAYSKYLNVEKGYNDALKLKKEKIKAIEIVIIEGKDTREWVAKNGGHLIETFIHNVLIATLLVGTPKNWENIKWTIKDDKVELESVYNNIEIKLIMEKNAEETMQKRYINIIFDNSKRIYEDLDTEEMLLISKKANGEEKEQKCISVKRKYRRKYAIQTDLVYRVANGEFNCETVDGRENQISCLRWLIDEMEKEKEKHIEITEG